MSTEKEAILAIVSWLIQVGTFGEQDLKEIQRILKGKRKKVKKCALK